MGIGGEMNTEAKAILADKYFELWWQFNGGRFEDLLGFKSTNREMASYGFVGGFIAGYNYRGKEEKEK